MPTTQQTMKFKDNSNRYDPTITYYSINRRTLRSAYKVTWNCPMLILRSRSGLDSVLGPQRNSVICIFFYFSKLLFSQL